MTDSVTVLGLGYVGLPTACLLATAGFDVRGVDIDPVLVQELNAGRTALSELGVKSLLAEAMASGNFVADTIVGPSDAYFICVPTPLRLPGHKPDLCHVRKATLSIMPHIQKGNLIILESTSPVGTTRDIVGDVVRSHGFDAEEDVDICYCPERVMPGNTVTEIVSNDRIIGGLTRRAAGRAKDMYKTFCHGRLHTTNAEVAEFCKLMENTYRDVNIALANSFARMGEQAGIDVWKAINMANLHPRVDILNPGSGVGGHCIPVDPWFLVDRFGEASTLLRAAREINDAQPKLMLDRAMAAGLRRGGRIAVLGVAYRADIDDARESPTFKLLRAAVGANLTWRSHDPFVKAANGYNGLDLNLNNDLDWVLDGADAAFVMTDHVSYKTLSPIHFNRMAGRLISDGRNILNHLAFSAAGFEILVLGNGTGGAGNP